MTMHNALQFLIVGSKKCTLFGLFLFAVMLVSGCNGQDAPEETTVETNSKQSTEQMHATEFAETGIDVCKHWSYLAPVVEENIRYAKEFIPDDYLQEIRRGYELDEIPKSSGGYTILNAMVDAADKGKSPEKIEQLAISICRSFPPDAVDDAGGAYEAFTR